MRTIFLATALAAAASIAQAQSPAAKLPAQGEPPSATVTPNAGNDEVAARRQLEDQGYKDVRGLTPNGDGTFSGRATRDAVPGLRAQPGPEVNVTIDSSGNVRER